MGYGRGGVSIWLRRGVRLPLVHRHEYVFPVRARGGGLASVRVRKLAVVWACTTSMLWILILTTPAGGSARALPSITEFQLRRAGNPVGITAGPDQNLWFTKSGGNEIGRITTDG